MIAAPSRIDHLRRFVAWVLDLEPDRVADMSEDRAYRILAGERRHDADHLETLRAMSATALADELPFAAAYWRGHTPTREDHARRLSVSHLTPAGVVPRWANTGDASEALALARASSGDRAAGAPTRAPEPPRATPDELRELLSPDAARDLLERARAHTPAPIVGLR